MPEFIATTEAQVLDVVHSARESKTLFEIVGAGTKRAFGRPMNCGTTLNVSGLNGIVDYRPEELIITAKPGTLISEITAALAEKNQRLGFDPPDLGPLFGMPANRGTIGGAISCDLNGSASLRFGRVRDHLLGIRAVNGFGEAFKAGGKVVKNVTGFDIPKLFCGAFGTLGILTEVTLRVFPKPPYSARFAVNDISPEEGLGLLRRIWSSPLEATGLSYSLSRAVLQLEGSATALEEKQITLRELLNGHDLCDLDSDTSGLTEFANSSDDIWRVSIPPSRAASLVDELKPIYWHAESAGGRLWIALKSDSAAIHEIAARHEAHATLVRSSDATRSVGPFPPLSPDRLALTRSVKAAFDPLSLFNPSRMYNGI